MIRTGVWVDVPPSEYVCKACGAQGFMVWRSFVVKKHADSCMLADEHRRLVDRCDGLESRIDALEGEA